MVLSKKVWNCRKWCSKPPANPIPLQVSPMPGHTHCWGLGVRNCTTNFKTTFSYSRCPSKNKGQNFQHHGGLITHLRSHIYWSGEHTTPYDSESLAMYLLLIPDFCNLCWNISAERFAFSTFQVWESHLYNRGSISYVLFQLRIWPHGPDSLQYFRISLGNNPPHQRCWKGIFVFE